jgi:hypothetical protein
MNRRRNPVVVKGDRIDDRIDLVLGLKFLCRKGFSNARGRFDISIDELDQVRRRM